MKWNIIPVHQPPKRTKDTPKPLHITIFSKDRRKKWRITSLNRNNYFSQPPYIWEMG